jgi:hypothetical protein
MQLEDAFVYCVFWFYHHNILIFSGSANNNKNHATLFVFPFFLLFIFSDITCSFIPDYFYLRKAKNTIEKIY